MKKYIIKIVKFLIVLTILLNIVSFYKARDLNKADLTLRPLELLDTTTYTLNYEKPILIYFWATWCPICKIESTHIQTLSKYFEVLTIAVDSGSDEEIQAYLDVHQLNFKVYNDSNREISEQFGIKGYPSILIYDKDKKLVSTDIGYTSTVSLYIKLLWSQF